MQPRESYREPTVPGMGTVTVRTAIFYAVMLLGVAALASKAHTLVLPGGLASQVGHNSEALLFAALVAAQIQFLRPALLGSRWRWPIALGVAGVHFLSAFALLQTGWTSSVVTLNEPIVGAGFLMLYIMWDRPLRLAPLVSLAVLAFVVVFFDTAFVLDQAESLVPFMLAPLALDVFDRTILEPEQPDRRVLRTVWIGVLFAIGIGFMILAAWAREDLQGWFRLAIDYGHRASEAYWGWILIHAYFGYWLGLKARARPTAPLSAGLPASGSGSQRRR